MAATGYTGGDPTKVSKTGDTMTGALVLPGDPTTPLQAADKAYVDGHSGNTSPAATVTDETGYGVTPTVGVDTTFAREDHTHGTVPAPNTVVPYSVPGTVSVVSGAARLYNDTGRTLTIRAVRATVGTAPVGASLIVDVLKGGTTIFTTQANRPTIAAGTNTSGKVTTMDVTTWADGDYLTVNVAQVGSATPGSDLTVQVWAA